MPKRILIHTYKVARRIVVAMIGGTVLLMGVAMIVLPGPAIVVIPAGLAILGLEFAWARRWLREVKSRAQSVIDRWQNGSAKPAPNADAKETMGGLHDRRNPRPFRN